MRPGEPVAGLMPLVDDEYPQARVCVCVCVCVCVPLCISLCLCLCLLLSVRLCACASVCPPLARVYLPPIRPFPPEAYISYIV